MKYTRSSYGNLIHRTMEIFLPVAGQKFERLLGNLFALIRPIMSNKVGSNKYLLIDKGIQALQ